MAAMLRSASAGLVLRRSSAGPRLPSCLSAVSFSDNTAAGRIERRHMEESDTEEVEKERRRRTQQRHGFSNGKQYDSFYTTLSWDDNKLPRGSSTDSSKTSSSVEWRTDISSRSSGSFWDKRGSWSWGSGDSSYSGGGDSCSGGGDSCGGD